jgi:hypothetical protein
LGSNFKGYRIDVDFPDGTSNTLMIGEKHVPKDKFGQDVWDSSLYNGFSESSRRSGGPFFPIAQKVDDERWLFGSCHPVVCQFVFIDGHVNGLPKHIDPVTLGLLCQRNDGMPIPDYGH